MAKNKRRKPGRGPGKLPGMTYMDAVSANVQICQNLIEDEAKKRFDRYMCSLQQMCIDAAFMAANDVFHMGPTRCEAFGYAMVDYINMIASIAVEDAKNDQDVIYTRAKIDERLKQICGDKFQPWEERYKDDDTRDH